MHLVGLDRDIQVEIVEQAKRDEALHDLAVVRLREAALFVHELVGVHAHADGAVRPGAFARGAEALDQEAHAVLERPTVLIGPAVEVRREECLHQHAVRAVDHDAVVPGLGQVRRRGAVRVDDLLDRGDAHLVGDVEVVRGLHRRWAEEWRVGAPGLVAPKVADARVVDLPEELRAMFVHRVRDGAERRDVLLQVGRGEAAATPLRHRRHRVEQQAAAALRARSVVTREHVGRLVPDVVAHTVGREVPPVLDLHRAEPDRARGERVCAVHGERAPLSCATFRWLDDTPKGDVRGPSLTVGR